MNPDEINSLAIRAISGLALIMALVALVGWAAGSSSPPVLVAGAGVETTDGRVGFASVTPAAATASTSTTVTTVAPDTDTKTTEAGAPAGTDITSPGSSTTAAPSPGTTASPATTTQPATTTTVRTSTTTASTLGTTTTSTPITTTTVRPTTTTTVKPTTTTTVRPTTTTTVKPTTTTTVRPTTTTTVKPTTTTIPPTTTTTTIPPTTTTTISLPGLLVNKFEGHDHGGVGAWEAHIKIEIRDENGGKAPYATVVVAWGGSDPGSQALASNKDGNIDTRIGEFADSTITLRLTDVRLAGFAYRPSLNEVSTTLLVEGPN